MMTEALAHMGRFATSSATSDWDNHMGSWMMGSWPNMMGWFGPAGWLGMILTGIVWVLIIVAVVLAIIWLFKQVQTPDKNKK